MIFLCTGSLAGKILQCLTVSKLRAYMRASGFFDIVCGRQGRRCSWPRGTPIYNFCALTPARRPWICNSSHMCLEPLSCRLGPQPHVSHNAQCLPGSLLFIPMLPTGSSLVCTCSHTNACHTQSYWHSFAGCAQHCVTHHAWL